MMLRNMLKVFLLVLLFVGIGVNASAALVDLGNGLIYDNDEARVWYKDLTQFTSMTYDTQISAISGISVAPVPGHTWGEFRMATLADMESLWLWDKNTPAEIHDAFIHTLAYTAGGNLHHYRMGRYDLFYDTSIGPAHRYARTGVTYLPDDSISGYNHNRLDSNWELDAFSADYIGAWAVADVDPVSLPGAVWLLGSGIVGLFGIRRR